MTRDLSVEHNGPDLLDLLAEHDHTCDYQAGLAAGLHLAGGFVQDYGHTSPRVDVVRIQSALFRASAVAACGECNASGDVIDEKGRAIDHHPTGGR